MERMGRTIVVGVIVSVIGGLLLAWAIPILMSPALVPNSTQEGGGSDCKGGSTPVDGGCSTVLQIQFDNDSSHTAKDCTAYLEVISLQGYKLLIHSSEFMVTGHGSAVPLTDNRGFDWPYFRFFGKLNPANPRESILYVSCDNYQSPKWKTRLHYEVRDPW